MINDDVTFTARKGRQARRWWPHAQRGALWSSSALLLAGGCTLLLAGRDDIVVCDVAADCPGSACIDGFCAAPGATGAEGEGDVGAGAGEGEGEGDVGEGEGDVGEGEGEGDVGEGEGEGEPGAPPRTCRALLDQGVATSGPASLDVDGSGVIDDTERGFFCEMTREGGGWTRVFLLDNTQPGFACPPEWRTKEMAPGIVGCERPQGGGSQPGIALRAPHGFNEVMGRVVGVVFGDQDAFSAHSGGLDDIYVDGVSLTTRTVGAREHVFTFVGGHPLDQQTEQHCPCEPGGAPAPAFVDRFFCDRASAAGARPGLGRAYDIGNPMWDGPGDRCAPDVDGYFARATLTPHTAEDGLELRIMSDQPTDDVANADENVALVFVDLYVR